jgi:hypothetical protein
MLNIRRGDTPFYRGLRNAARRIMSSTLPLPRFLNPLLRFGFAAQYGLPIMSRTFRRSIPKQNLLSRPRLVTGDGKLPRRWYSAFIGRTGSQSSPVLF